MSRVRNEDGFTLVELLVTCVIMLIIFAAVLGALEAFQRGSKTANGRGDNQDATRRVVDHLAAGLRDVVGTGTGTLDRAAGNDVVFRVVDPATPPVSGGSNFAKLMFRRYCVDSGQALYEMNLHWSSPSPPSLPAAACPGSGWENVQKVADHVTTAGGNIFSYTPNSTSAARIDVDLSIDLDPLRAPAASQLHSAVALRNVNRPPTVVMTCQAVGGGQVICDSIGSADPDGGALTYAWSYASGACPGGAMTALSTLPQINKASLTPNSQYCFQLNASDPSGIAGTATQTVKAL